MRKKMADEERRKYHFNMRMNEEEFDILEKLPGKTKTDKICKLLYKEKYGNEKISRKEN
jgi:hypothetical protein